ncbi:hypothetical protein [Nocardia amikacinitolerans]|uniref:MmyB family transcriptional regulator n=1 Tax=Nocardia amikacinitolerans TaxID=756689 RepID=UPI003CCC1479
MSEIESSINFTGGVVAVTPFGHRVRDQRATLLTPTHSPIDSSDQLRTLRPLRSADLETIQLVSFECPRRSPWSFYLDWPAVARSVVAGLRVGYGAASHDRRVGEVLAELLDVSPEFTEIRARHDARGKLWSASGSIILRWDRWS